MTAGKLIVLEGIDGAGTTTQARLLVDRLVERGRRTVLTCEPTSGPVGSVLRQILAGRCVVRLADQGCRPVHNDVIALLFAADRLDHLDSDILPRIEAGVQVVSDRYYHSSFTYQSLAGDLAWIRSLNARARKPDVTFLLDLPAERAASRRNRVRDSEELYERLELQQRLRTAYLELVRQLGDETIVVIDGDRSVEEVHQAIAGDLARRFGWN